MTHLLGKAWAKELYSYTMVLRFHKTAIVYADIVMQLSPLPDHAVENLCIRDVCAVSTCDDAQLKIWL